MPTLLDKIWEAHVVARAAGQPDLLYIDRHLIHEVTSPQAFEGLRANGRPLRRPDLTFGVMDHVTPTDSYARPLKDPVAEAQLAALEANHKEFGFTLFPMGDCRQGVIHVTMPEQGLILPGNTVVCGDSHTATHGALGALAFGIGTSEVEHVFATQTIKQIKPKQMAVNIDGSLKPGVTAKDLILYLIGRLGSGGATGYALEYRGLAVTALSMEGRLTMSNMAIECGARMGLIAPDETTFKYLEGRPFAPKGRDFEMAKAWWATLFSDPGAEFTREINFRADDVKPQVTWGTNPGQVTPIDGAIPYPAEFSDPVVRQAAEKALAYQALKPGTAITDIAVDYVFIGSCTNARLEDLRLAARIIKGRQVAPAVRALVSPGSGLVKLAAEREGLDRIFIEAGFEWRLPGCSMCLGMNPDLLPPGKRSASTSNRNFEDRQGRGGRTHLVSPAVAAATALAGYFRAPEL